MQIKWKLFRLNYACLNPSFWCTWEKVLIILSCSNVSPCFRKLQRGFVSVNPCRGNILSWATEIFYRKYRVNSKCVYHWLDLSCSNGSLCQWLNCVLLSCVIENILWKWRTACSCCRLCRVDNLGRTRFQLVQCKIIVFIVNSIVPR